MLRHKLYVALSCLRNGFRAAPGRHRMGHDRPAARIIDVAPVRKAQRWDRYERTEEVMDQESFVHLRTNIWRMLRDEQQPDDAFPKTTGGVTS